MKVEFGQVMFEFWQIKIEFGKVMFEKLLFEIPFFYLSLLSTFATRFGYLSFLGLASR